MKKIISLLLLSVLFLILGCETLPPPTPKKILSNPFGTTPLQVGMTKEEVVNLWGNPNEVLDKGRDELGTAKEEWIYHARYPGIPVNYNYLSKTKSLIFAGNNLISWEENN